MRMVSNTDDDARVRADRRQEMEIFDRLPARIRRRLAVAEFNFLPSRIADFLRKRGVAGAIVVIDANDR